jgi:hypothetical protein
MALSPFNSPAADQYIGVGAGCQQGWQSTRHGGTQEMHANSGQETEFFFSREGLWSVQLVAPYRARLRETPFMDAIIKNFPHLQQKRRQAGSPVQTRSRRRHTLLRWTGDNPDREGLLDTPRRVAKAYREMFGGYDKDPGRGTGPHLRGGLGL